MNFYIDTEFNEQPGSIELISIGIVSELGDTFYAENSLLNKDACNEWVQENVLPKLLYYGKDALPGTVGISDEKKVAAFSRPAVLHHHKVYGGTYLIKKHLLEWFEACSQDRPLERVGEPEFWAYFADYDWVVFCWIFGRMIDLPPNFPKFCLDLKQEMKQNNLSGDWKREKCPDPEDEHNALVDAMWNKKLHEKINEEISKELEHE